MQHALVVGGTSGIGHGIALALAKRGNNISITIAGRSRERGQEIVQQLNELSVGSGKDDVKHSFQQVDAFDLASVKKLASSVKKTDVLIMTQGMATTQGYMPTVDGLDQKLQLHYFSRIYLAKLIMAQRQNQINYNNNDKLLVLSVLSAGVHGRYERYETDFELKEHYSIKNAADAAGFYNDAGLESLALEFPHNITCCHASPGFVNTNWGTEFPWYLRGLVRCLQPLGRSIETCGSLLTEGLLSLPRDQGNFFLMNQDGKIIKNGIKHTPREREVIWTKTMELLPQD